MWRPGNTTLVAITTLTGLPTVTLLKSSTIVSTSTTQTTGGPAVLCVPKNVNGQSLAEVCDCPSTLEKNNEKCDVWQSLFVNLV